MNPIDVIDDFYEPDSKAYGILQQHGRLVAEKALETAKKVLHLNPDLIFIEEAAMLHDIGMFMTDTPRIGCHGTHPYIAHGFLGRMILEKKGFPRHGLVCERHVGMGITAQQIKSRGLSLPFRDMVPITIEEQIICYADKFYSKNGKRLNRKNAKKTIIKGLEKYGQDQVEKFNYWCRLFQEI